MTETIVLDTDFLIKISNDPLPKFDFQKLALEYSFVTIPAVESELKGLSKHKTARTSRRAKNALRIIGKGGKISIMDKPRASVEADIELIDLATRNSELVIGTLDHSLLSRLENEGLAYLTLRNNRPLFRAVRKEQRI